MPIRTYGLGDVLRALNQDSTAYLAPDANEIISQFLPGAETLKVTPSWTETLYTPYPFLVADQDGPTGLWLLGDPLGSTTAFDSNPYLVGGKNSGTATSVTFGGSGPISGATSASFNGTSSQISFGTQSAWGLSGTQAISLECWAKPASLTPAGNVLMVDLETSSSTTGLRLFMDTTGHVHVEKWVAGVLKGAVTSTGTLSTSAWTHVVATYNGSTVTLYLNGASSGTPLNDSTAWGSVSPGLWLGTLLGTGNWWAGSLYGCAFYPIALVSTQVANHHSWGTAANASGAYTYNFGSPVKRGWLRYPNPPKRGTNLWGSAVWGSFIWG